MSGCCVRLPGVINTFEHQNVLRATTACTFPHLNIQKCSDVEVFVAFWLPNVLCATTACNFSPLISPDGSAPAALASPLFDPPEPQIIGKTQCFATFLRFRAPASSFFCLSLLWSSFSINNETEFVLNVFFYDPSHKHTLTNIPCLYLGELGHVCIHSDQQKWPRDLGCTGSILESVAVVWALGDAFLGSRKLARHDLHAAFKGITLSRLGSWLEYHFQIWPHKESSMHPIQDGGESHDLNGCWALMETQSSLNHFTWLKLERKCSRTGNAGKAGLSLETFWVFVESCLNSWTFHTLSSIQKSFGWHGQFKTRKQETLQARVKSC